MAWLSTDPELTNSLTGRGTSSLSKLVLLSHIFVIASTLTRHCPKLTVLKVPPYVQSTASSHCSGMLRDLSASLIERVRKGGEEARRMSEKKRESKELLCTADGGPASPDLQSSERCNRLRRGG